MSVWRQIIDFLVPGKANAPVSPEHGKKVKRPLRESTLTSDFWLSNYVDLLDRFRDGGVFAYPISNPQDRRYGSNFPFWYSEQQLSVIRAQARLVATTSPNALGLLNGLCSYVIGSGYNYRIGPKSDSDIDDSTISAVQRIVNRFMYENEWELFEQEIFTRSRTDGECFLRLFPQPSGRMLIRTIEPEQIIQPPGEDFSNWSYGIETDPDDVFNIMNYHVNYFAPKGEDLEHDKTKETPQGEIVASDRIVHIKCNVPRAIKRGLSDFSYETLETFNIASKLRRNLGEGASVQSAIAAVRQHDAASHAQVEAFVEENIDYSVAQVPTGRATDYQRIEPGTFLDIPKGMNYVKPPGADSAKDHLDIFQALLRSAGNRHNAPEWLSSANVSGANYASSLTAESPFLRNCVRLQSYYKRAFTKVVYEAIRHAAQMGEIPINILENIDLIVTPPGVEARDKIADSQADQIYYNLGVKSVQTIAQERGLDFEQEQHNIDQMQEKLAEEIVPGEDDGTQMSDSALNGLQIENLTAIVMRVATGQIPVSVGKAIAKAAFPLMPEENLNEIFPEELEAINKPSPKAAGGLKPVKELPTGVDKDLQKPPEPDQPIAENLQEDVKGKYDHIEFHPPKQVRSAAQKGLKLREKYGRGGTAVGLGRARDIVGGKEMTPKVVNKMVSFFARHEVDKKGEGWGVDSAGYIAWLLWGGDAGWAWAKKVQGQMEAADKNG
jgi:hypothetical protein